jgi:2-keto-4-pentenoate hydratase/2-oxohepta-3-ene-1,7-dioic acid hydratase in catechol pathway
MRLLTFTYANKQSYGAMTERGVVDVGAILGDQYPDIRSVLAADALPAVADAVADATAVIDGKDIEYLPVIPQPGKIFCIGLNYESHRLETKRDVSKYPTIFTRFADTQVGHKQAIILPKLSDNLDYEGELAVIIGKPGRYISRESAMSHVAGYSCYNDASVRDFQRHSTQFTPGKNFPSTGGFGPYLATVDEVPNIHNVRIQTRLNGKKMQDSNTSRLIFDIPALIAYLSSFTCLSAGDVMATGTPGGVGVAREPPVFLRPGDEFVVDIEDVGVLSNAVSAEA